MRDVCKSLEPLLHDYAEGWLAESQQAEVLRHLQHCPACREKLQAWERVGLALRGLPRLPAPARVRAPIADSEPRVALRLALALCLPAAMLVAVHGSQFQPPALEQIAPYAPLHTLAERTQEGLSLLWSWIRGIV
ncbi:MAG: hypothetical protein CFK48_08515 [Armatimonadetes bacterium CP1_7O]|nr:MAG: hypothetical protein CFK48_08515 [Armatimonadetes bacterium CP1_7O]